MSDGRTQSQPCTCHPDDNPPVPCPQKYALQECREAAERRVAKKPNAATETALWSRDDHEQ